MLICSPTTAVTCMLCQTHITESQCTVITRSHSYNSKIISPSMRIYIYSTVDYYLGFLTENYSNINKMKGIIEHRIIENADDSRICFLLFFPQCVVITTRRRKKAACGANKDWNPTSEHRQQDDSGCSNWPNSCQVIVLATPTEGWWKNRTVPNGSIHTMYNFWLWKPKNNHCSAWQTLTQKCLVLVMFMFWSPKFMKLMKDAEYVLGD